VSFGLLGVVEEGGTSWLVKKRRKNARTPGRYREFFSEMISQARRVVYRREKWDGPFGELPGNG
jgi:hypothetical protein